MLNATRFTHLAQATLASSLLFAFGGLSMAESNSDEATPEDLENPTAHTVTEEDPLAHTRKDGKLKDANRVPIPGDQESPYAGLTQWAEDHAERTAWFEEARFGLFIHWGLYAGAGGYWPPIIEPENKYKQAYSEWIQTWAKIPVKDYGEGLRPLFVPNEGVAQEWAQLAKQAGMKYSVLTTKHHEGYTLFNSQHPYSLNNEFTGGTNISPDGRDLTAEFAEAMREEGIKPGFYFSLIDWAHPHSPTSKEKAPEGEFDQEIYMEYMRTHFRELMENYGDIAVLWVDFTYPKQGGATWGTEEILKHARKHQPDILINNRFWHDIENYKGDFFTPEKTVPATGVEGRLFEVCHTINESFGFSHHDQKNKSVEELVKLLVDIVSKGGNLLLNVGPDRRGHVPDVVAQKLQGMGKWMEVNGEAIYGTQASPFTELPFDGRVTRKDAEDGSQILYLHLFSVPENRVIELPDFDFSRVTSATVAGEAVEFNAEAGQVTLPEKEATKPAASDLFAQYAHIVPVIKLELSAAE